MLRRRSAPASAPPTPDRPAPPPGARDLVVVVLDSLRWDAAVASEWTCATELGPLERRHSYASWTAPSHYNLLMGLLPHEGPVGVHAAEVYRHEYRRYGERLGADGVDVSKLLPSLFLPSYLRNHLGYRTHARVSMPVLNPTTAINRDFDSFELMPNHREFGAMVEQLTFDDERPSFWLLNVGETHYPYAVPGDDTSTWPHLPGVHGVVRGAGDDLGFFTQAELDELRGLQVRAAHYADRVVGRLLDVVPPGTWVVVTSDHGELFGEDGCFGHGPFTHEKVFEVPFVEGRV